MPYYQSKSRNHDPSGSSTRETSTSDGRSRENVKVVSWLEKLLDPVWNHQFEMGRHASLVPTGIKSSAPSHLLDSGDNALGDNIKIWIPYADDGLHCMFSFVWLDPTIPPYLVTIQPTSSQSESNYQDYLERFLLKISPELAWNPNEDVECFLNFIKALVTDFGEYERQRCSVFNHQIRQEIDLLTRNGMNFQVLLHETEPGKKYGALVCFTVFMRTAEITKIPDASEYDREFVITVLFSNFGYARLKTSWRLDKSPCLSKLFRDETVTMPSISTKIFDHSRYIHGLMNAQLAVVCDAMDINQELAHRVQKMFPVCRVVDYVAHTFENVSFEVKIKNHVFLLKIEFPLRYPHHRLKISVVSNYCETTSKVPHSISDTLVAGHIKPEIIFRDLEAKIRRVVEIMNNGDSEVFGSK